MEDEQPGQRIQRPSGTARLVRLLAVEGGVDMRFRQNQFTHTGLPRQVTVSAVAGLATAATSGFVSIICQPPASHSAFHRSPSSASPKATRTNEASGSGTTIAT